MDSETLLALAERVEKTSGADRDLDAEIAMCPYIRDPYPDVPAYTASLDAAMTLVPEGWHISSMGEGPDEHPRSRGFRYGGTWFVQLHSQQKGLMQNLKWASAATPALALASACLRARANLETDHG